MTVNTISSIAEFVTNGVTTNYPFYFKFLANEDLVVTYVAPDGGSSILILGTHYVVNGAGSDQGGSIVTTTALPGPGQLVVSREMDAFQQTSLRNQGKFLAETHEDVFDKLTMLIQQGFAIFKRALTRPFGREYFFAENRRIASVKDPVEPQDAATKIWAQRYIGDLIEVGQGPVNTAANVLYTTPQGVVKTVQDMSGAGGAAMIGESHGGSIQDRLNIISCGTGVSFKDSGMIGDYVSPSNRGTVNKVEWGKMLSLHGGRFYAEPNANYYLGAIGATDLLATITHGEPIYIDLQGATLWLDLESPTQGRLTAALAYTIDTPIYCYGGGGSLYYPARLSDSGDHAVLLHSR